MSLEVLEQAAVAGDAESQYSLGCSYYEGTDVQEDWERAAVWFRQAAEQGYAEAIEALGRMKL